MNDKGKYWDEAWNTVIGCSKCSPGCKNCWAENLHNMRYEAYYRGKKVPDQYGKPFNEIQLLENRIDMPLHWRNPRTVFVNNMGDTLHPDVPFEFVDKMMDVIKKCAKHKFLMLTKRVKRMGQYFSAWQDYPYPENLWPGATICNQAEADEKIPILLQIPAAKRWLSIEPMLGPVDLNEMLPGHYWYNWDKGEHGCCMIDWVVIGCESGPNRRPCKIEDMISIVEQCKAAGVKVFVKQVNINGKVSKKISEWPQELQVRDEI